MTDDENNNDDQESWVVMLFYLSVAHVDTLFFMVYVVWRFMGGQFGWPTRGQDARSWRCREVIPPGGKVKFQTLTISSSKITLEPTKPSISHSCPGAHGLGPSPKSSLGMAPTRLSWKSHVAAKRLIPGEHCEAAVGTSLSHVPTGHSDEEKTEKRALQKSRATYKIKKKAATNMIGSFGSFGSSVAYSWAGQSSSCSSRPRQEFTRRADVITSVGSPSVGESLGFWNKRVLGYETLLCE